MAEFNERSMVCPSVPNAEEATGLQSVDALMAYHDEAFVRMAYFVLLGRAIDSDGLNYFLSRLRTGIDKAQILAEIKFSPEGQVYVTSLAGLDVVLKSYGWLKSPVLGRLVRIRKRLDSGDTILCRLRALDNQLFRQQDSLETKLCHVDKHVGYTSENLTLFEHKVEREIAVLQQQLREQYVDQLSTSALFEEHTAKRLDGFNHGLSEQQTVLAQQLTAHQVALNGLEDQFVIRLDGLAQQITGQQTLLTQKLTAQQAASAVLERQFDSKLDDLTLRMIEQQVTSASLEAQLVNRLDGLTLQISEQQAVLAQQLALLNAASEAKQQQEEEAVVTENMPREIKEYRVAVRPLSGELPGLAAMPKVSIVVVQYQKSDVTSRCLRSVFRYTDMQDVEVVVVDNGSEIGHVEALEREFGTSIRILRLETNRLFGEGNNIGVEAAHGELIVLMNNDVAVTAGWLSTLRPHLRMGIGIVAPTFLYPDGRVQECGADVDEQGYSTQNFKFGKQSDLNLPRDPFDCDYVSAALMLLRKQDFLAVGGFALEYEPAYYEDVDLCLKITACQLSIRCVPHVRVYHVENATSVSYPFGASLTTLLTITRNVLVSRWHHYLQNRKPANLNSRFHSDLISLENLTSDTDLPTALFYLPTIGLDEITRYAMTIAHTLGTTHQLIFTSSESCSRLRLWQLAHHWGLNVSTVQNLVWDKLPVDWQWDKVFVFGTTLFPSIASLSDHSVYVCDFPVDTKAPVWAHQVLVGGYQYWCQSEWIKYSLCEDGWVEPERIKVLPLPVHRFATAEKENIILSVGSFVNHNQQHVLIEAFERLASSGYFDDWRLILMGSPGSQSHELVYLQHCMEKAEELPVGFIFDDSVEKLNDLYSRAAVYWHGAGLGVDASSQPEQLDRAGVAALEAASAGCSVFIPNSGTVFEWMCSAPDGVYTCANIDDLVSLMVEIKRSTGFDPGIAKERIAAWLEDRDMAHFVHRVLSECQNPDGEIAM